MTLKKVLLGKNWRNFGITYNLSAWAFIPTITLDIFRKTDGDVDYDGCLLLIRFLCFDINIAW